MRCTKRLQEAEVAAEAGNGGHDVTGWLPRVSSSSAARNRLIAQCTTRGAPNTANVRAVQIGVLVRERNKTWSPPRLRLATSRPLKRETGPAHLKSTLKGWGTRTVHCHCSPPLSLSLSLLLPLCLLCTLAVCCWSTSPYSALPTPLSRNSTPFRGCVPSFAIPTAELP